MTSRLMIQQQILPALAPTYCQLSVKKIQGLKEAVKFFFFKKNFNNTEKLSKRFIHKPTLSISMSDN